jgi:hypothetical protein
MQGPAGATGCWCVLFGTPMFVSNPGMTSNGNNTLGL